MSMPLLQRRGHQANARSSYVPTSTICLCRNGSVNSSVRASVVSSVEVRFGKDSVSNARPLSTIKGKSFEMKE